MGSVGMKKCSPADLHCAGLDVHYEKKLRMSDQVHHANKDIDTSMTYLNYNLSVSSDGHIERDAMTWSQAKAQIQRRVDEIDEMIPPKRRLSDDVRRTWFMLEIHCPEAIQKAGREDEFFRLAFENLNQSMDGNLVWGQVHKDEQHAYWKSTGKKDDNGKTIYEERMSLQHMDVIGVAYDPEKGCNMKSFMNQTRIQKMQDSVRKMVMEQYGIDMQTGEGHTDITIEQYKEQSEEIARTKSLEMARIEEEQKLAEIMVAQSMTTDVPETWEPYYRGIGKHREIEGYEIPRAEAEFMLRRADMTADLTRREEDLRAREHAVEEKERTIEDDLEYATRKRSEALKMKKEVQDELDEMKKEIPQMVDSHIDTILSLADKSGEMKAKYDAYKDSREYQQLQQIYELNRELDSCWDIDVMLQERGVEGALEYLQDEAERQLTRGPKIHFR